MKANEIFSAFGVVAAVIAVGAAAVGWVLNLVAIANTVGDPLTPIFMLRCVGIFIAPVGCILGWI
jgi:hypothetical protein